MDILMISEKSELNYPTHDENFSPVRTEVKKISCAKLKSLWKLLCKLITPLWNTYDSGVKRGCGEVWTVVGLDCGASNKYLERSIWLKDRILSVSALTMNPSYGCRFREENQREIIALPLKMEEGDMKK